MNNQVFSNKAIAVIVILLVGGIIFLTDYAAIETLQSILPFDLPYIEIIPDELIDLPIPETEPTSPPKQSEPPKSIFKLPEEKEELMKAIEESMKEEPTTPPKTINLNELTESTEQTGGLAPPFKTFKEEVTWYAQFSDIHNLEEIPQGCDPVIGLYKGISELDNKSYLAKIILEICDL